MKKGITLQTDYMKENQFKIGDTITIHKEPSMWSSELSDKNPKKGIIYPWKGIIEGLKTTEIGLNGLISGYGFSMDHIKDYTINSNTYEIY